MHEAAFYASFHVFPPQRLAKLMHFTLFGHCGNVPKGCLVPKQGFGYARLSVLRLDTRTATQSMVKRGDFSMRNDVLRSLAVVQVPD